MSEGMERTQIHLRYDGDLVAQVREAHRRDVEAVNLDRSGGELDDAEQCEHDA